MAAVDTLLPAPRKQLRFAEFRRIAVGLVPVLLIAVSILPGSGQFLEPNTLAGRVIAVIAVTVGPVLIYWERRHDLHDRRVPSAHRIAVGETLITLVIDAAILVCGAMMLIALFAFLYLV